MVAAVKGKEGKSVKREREWGQGGKKKERKKEKYSYCGYCIESRYSSIGAKLVNWVRFDTVHSQSNSIGQIKWRAVNPTIGCGGGFSKGPKIAISLGTVSQSSFIPSPLSHKAEYQCCTLPFFLSLSPLFGPGSRTPVSVDFPKELVPQRPNC